MASSPAILTRTIGSKPDIRLMSAMGGKRTFEVVRAFAIVRGEMKRVARLARNTDLDGLLELFETSEVSRSAEARRAEEIWLETLSRTGVSVFVSEAAQRLVATCMLVTAPNLLREGRSHGFIENVVTHPDFRGQGYGSAVLGAALEHAWQENCHHVLLQSGRTDSRVHTFYEKAGFVPGLRTAYVAMRPS